MLIGRHEFDVKNRTYIMGILNVTPDSFSDGGSFYDADAALFHAEKMQKKGAHILDIGGESTRPGHTQISDEEEIERVVPVIEAIKKRVEIPVSVDTYKSRVAEAAILAGADMINDIWGLKYDGKMAEIIARYQVPCCLMHNRKDTNYSNFVADVVADLKESVTLAEKAGISREQIVLDPGVGFAKNYEQNLEIIREINKIAEIGCPVLLGTSRKSVIGLTLDLPVEKRLEGTLATTVFGVMHGCAFVRVHDIEENARAIRMTEAILKQR